MSKHRVLSLKPHPRLEWRRQDGHDETQKPDHSASLGDSITSSIRIGFSVHTRPPNISVGRVGRLTPSGRLTCKRGTRTAITPAIIKTVPTIFMAYLPVLD